MCFMLLDIDIDILVLQGEGDTPRCQKMFGNVQFSVSIHTHTGERTQHAELLLPGEKLFLQASVRVSQKPGGLSVTSVGVL